jgi:hypothetical protein
MSFFRKIGLAVSLLLCAGPAFAQTVYLPTLKNASGANVPSQGVVAVDSGGIDATDPILHAVQVSCLTGCSTGGASENHIGEVGLKFSIAAASFTTPSGTTAYSAGQLIANSATAASVAPLSFGVCRVAGGTFQVDRIRVKTTDTGFAGQTVKVWLFKDSPTATNGDHGTALTTESNFLGETFVTLSSHFSDYEKGIGVPVGGLIKGDCATGSSVIYGLLVAGTPITPLGAKTISATVEASAN